MNTTVQKWIELYAFQKQHRDVSGLHAGADAEKLSRIEALTGEKLPEDYKALYLAHDGEDEEGGFSTLFGLGFMTLDEVISDLEAARRQLKPESRSVADPETSRKLTDRLVAFFLEAAQSTPGWEKLEFGCSAHSFEGPYIYLPGEEHRDILDIDDLDAAYPIVEELAEAESSYNWDELEFTVYPEGNYTFERKDYDFADNIGSWPEGAVKKKFFHHLWVPVFKDYGGNFIGIDLDPDVKGRKGQVLVFGRDEDPQFVVAEDLDRFFTLLLDRIHAQGGKPEGLPFMEDAHLHEVLKEIVIGE